MAISEQTTKDWRDRIELAVMKAEKAQCAIGDILCELDGLGQEIEKAVDSQSKELVEADKERAEAQVEIEEAGPKRPA